MRNFGILILIAGLALGLYSITMDVSVSLAARDFGYGIQTPAMEVANLDKMSRRQNYMIFSGILSVVGAILLGFGSIHSKQVLPAQREDAPSTSSEEDNEFATTLGPSPDVTGDPTSFSICPKCRHMGSGHDTACGRCGLNFSR